MSRKFESEIASVPSVRMYYMTRRLLGISKMSLENLVEEAPALHQGPVETLLDEIRRFLPRIDADLALVCQREGIDYEKPED